MKTAFRRQRSSIASATVGLLALGALAAPSLAAAATLDLSAPDATIGQTVQATAELSESGGATGTIRFQVFGPGDSTCSGTALSPAPASAAVSSDGPHLSGIFTPPAAGIYSWSAEFLDESETVLASAPCALSTVAKATPSLNASAGAATIGGTVAATATLAGGAIPSGQLTFRAFGPGDATCSAGAIFTWTVAVAGNGAYGSAPFAPTQVGTYRWTVAYSGDANHAAATVGCGAAASAVAKARPSLLGAVGQRLTVGKRFRDFVALAGGQAPGGTITFSIYAPGDTSCATPAFVNVVAVQGNGVYRSDPFVASRTGTYRFVATYSGDAANQATTEPCGASAQLARVRKREPRLLPRARLLDGQLSIRALLAGAASPTGVISFRLFGPGDRRCAGRPAFGGSLRIRSNGRFSLAEYLTTRPGVYRLALAYSGDARNMRSRIDCERAQRIKVRD